jgi:hypothetical protein
MSDAPPATNVEAQPREPRPIEGAIMQDLTLTLTATGRARARTSRRTWRTAGALILVSVALLFSAIGLQALVDPAATPAQVAHAYAAASIPLAQLGAYLEASSFLVFAVAAAVVFGLFATRSAVARHAATAFLVLAGVYVAATLAVGFPPEIAAMQGAHFGASPAAVAMVGAIRNEGFVLQTVAYGAATLALGVASIAARLRVWWGWGAVIVGALTIVATAIDPNLPNQLTMLWWVVLAVAALIRPPQPVARDAAAEPGAA